MPLWFWIVAALLLAGLLATLLLPLRFELSAEAHAEPDGHWAGAAGVALGPVALSSVAARGVPATLHVFAFGKRRFSRELFAPEDGERDERVESEEPAKPEQPATEPTPSRKPSWWRSKIDPVDGLAWIFGERRRLRWDLDVELRYSFRDVALTGKMLGGLYMFSALLPRGIHLRQTPGWESVDRGALQLTGTLRIFAGLVLCDLIWYMLRRSIRPRRKPLAEAASQAWPKPKSSTS
jgi:hypothetical protein